MKFQKGRRKRPMQWGEWVFLWLFWMGWVGVQSELQALPMEQRYHVRHWTSEQGLPTGQIACLHQTEDGFLWMGTKMSLVRFDGRNFVVYDRNNTPSLQNSDILCMVPSGENGLWMGTAGGVAHLDQQGFTFYSGPFPARNRGVTAIAVNRAGKLWVGNQGALYEVDPGVNAWTEVKAAARQRRNQITSILEEKDGTLWLGTEVSVMRREAGQDRFEEVWFNELNPDPVMDLRRHPTGQVTWSSFHAWFEWAGGKLLTHPWLHSPNRYPRTPLTMEGPESGLTYCGDSIGFGTLGFDGEKTPPLLLPEGVRNVKCALRTRDGSVWIGTSGQGLYQFLPHHFEALRESDGLPCEDARSIWTEDGREIWLASHRGITQWKDGDLAMHISPPGKGGARTLFSVLKDREGRVWTGGRQMFEVLDAALNPVKWNSELGAATQSSMREVRGLYEDRDGTLWAAAMNGLFRLSNGVWQAFADEAGLKGGSLLNIQRDSEGVVWIGTTIGRVWRFDGTRFIGFQQEARSMQMPLGEALTHSTRTGLLLQESAIPDGFVGPVLAEDDGTVWFGSTAGLICYRKGMFTRLTTDQGLAENFVLNMVADDLGHYWLGGHQGIHRIRKSELEAVIAGQSRRVSPRTFGLVDGMPSVECNGGSWPSSAKTKNGTIYFLTTKGPVWIHPESLPSMDTPCVAALESVRADGDVLMSRIPSKESKAADGRRYGRVSGESGVQLKPGSGKVLEFQFTAVEFRHASQIRIQYQLEGQDREWVDVQGDQRVAYYTNLRPGDYEFKLRATRPGADWPQEVSTFSFSIIPHYWQRPAVYIGGGILFMVGMIALFRYRFHLRLKIIRLEQANALENERIRIARDMHDTLGARLSQIALISTHRHSPSQSSLAEVAVLAREAMRDLRELIWVVNPQNDSLPRFAEFISQYSESFLAPAGIRTRLDIPLDLPEVIVPSSTRHALALTLKEALNNILRHAAASEVQISLRLDPPMQAASRDEAPGNGMATPKALTSLEQSHSLFLELIDNGVGFEPGAQRPNPQAGRGHGLVNMNERIHALHGHLNIQSHPGAGTQLTIAVPITISRPSQPSTLEITAQE